MTIMIATGIDVPAKFPMQSYEHAHSFVKQQGIGSVSAEKFSGAWNALGYRYSEAVQCAAEFEASFLQHGGAPPFPERFRQERSIFDFYSAAISALDTVAFAIFAIAHHKKPAAFPLATVADEAKVSPKHLLSKLQADFSSDPITTAWSSVYSDARNIELRELRNVLTHRLGPGRAHHAGGPNDGKTLWKHGGGVMAADFLEPHLDDLTGLLAGIVPAVAVFAT